MNFIPTGILPAMITPLTNDGQVNEKALRKLINFLIDGGIHGIFSAGTTGEFYGLTVAQHRQVLEITVDEAKGRVPIYAGAAAITTAQTVELVNIAEEVGCDAISILTPFFMTPSQEQLITHYTTIAANTKLPILAYNNLPKTNVNITASTAVKLADVDNIVGIKDSTGDLTLTGEYIRLTKGKNFHVLAGRDTLIHAALCYGATGSICACANVAPRICADIYDKYISGDTKGSLEAQYNIAPLRIGFTLGTFPTVIKEALQLLGIDVGPCFLPCGPMNVEEKDQLKKILIDMEILK